MTFKYLFCNEVGYCNFVPTLEKPFLKVSFSHAYYLFKVELAYFFIWEDVLSYFMPES